MIKISDLSHHDLNQPTLITDVLFDGFWRQLRWNCKMFVNFVEWKQCKHVFHVAVAC